MPELKRECTGGAKKICRPLWTKGILLSPQYFQQQTLLNSLDDEGISRIGVMHPWGVWCAEFDAQALIQGRVKPVPTGKINTIRKMSCH